ncbi:MAG TPA: metallophosphoesterase family protein [Thermomicrobiales bacterium]|nr:metallophosphoesterase family protein [Thermomicrobiales bacterium]
MRVAVISDMHGNAIAFDAVLEDMRGRGIDQVVCLGDALQGGPQPAEVASRLRDLGCPVVIGNADQLVLAGEVDDGEELSDLQRAVREWSAAQIGDEGLALIGQFQPTVTIGLSGGRQLLCFHGSPASYGEIILPETSEDDVQQMLGQHLPAIMTGGHTHLQQLRRVGDSVFFNPGSIGLAFSYQQANDPPLADPWAEYAILTSDDTGAYAIEFRRLPYDVDAFVAVIRSSGMPYAEVLEHRYSRRSEA